MPILDGNTLDFVSHSAAQTRRLGVRLGLLLQPGDIICLEGELGTGKTCLTQGIAAGLGVGPQYRVTSPTFTLINEYPARVALAHIDLYRLEDIDEMVEIGLEHYLGGDSVCVIEWVERCEALLPDEHLRVHIAVTGDQSRRFEAIAHGERHRGLVLQWLRSTQPAQEEHERRS